MFQDEDDSVSKKEPIRYEISQNDIDFLNS